MRILQENHWSVNLDEALNHFYGITQSGYGGSTVASTGRNETMEMRLALPVGC